MQFAHIARLKQYCVIFVTFDRFHRLSAKKKGQAMQLALRFD
jgi:hypothetical protein